MISKIYFEECNNFLNYNFFQAFLYALNDDENKYRKSCFLSLAKLVLKVEN